MEHSDNPFLTWNVNGGCMFLSCMFFVCLLIFQDSILAVFEGDDLPSTPLISFTNNISPFLHLDTLLSPLIDTPFSSHRHSSLSPSLFSHLLPTHTLPFSLHNYAVSLLWYSWFGDATSFGINFTFLYFLETCWTQLVICCFINSSSLAFLPFSL